MGCAIACAAALANLSYKQMRRYFNNGKIKEQASGFYNRDIVAALRMLKIEARACSIKKWSNKKIKVGSIVFIGSSRKYPMGHYILKTRRGWMNPWKNYPIINPAKAGFQKMPSGKIRWIITTEQHV